MEAPDLNRRILAIETIQAKKIQILNDLDFL